MHNMSEQLGRRKMEDPEVIIGSLNPNDTRGKTVTCKAAVAYGPGEPFVVERVLVHPPQKMEVRIKILFTSICHTDLSAWQGENEAQRAYPRIFGHEASGIVESVGEGVNDMKEGDLVVPIFNGECGDCKYCKCEKTNMCERFGVDPMKKVMASDGATRFSTMDGKPIFHFLNTSTFTEYTVVDSACVVKIHVDGDGDLNPYIKRLTLLSCGVSTGVGAAWNTADVHFGSAVAVFGLGAVGLSVAEGARARGASKIIGVDINSDKFIKGLGIDCDIRDSSITTIASHPPNGVVPRSQNSRISFWRLQREDSIATFCQRMHGWSGEVG
ncbi:alcohol dehydrogenase-like 4 isoform X2 [Glycine soja]|uniref:alcohol dehydrogenase-like 4 isoform X2 n=1 Tax=Glycine soja TaxID=3848 RepID=UPI001040B465|nr:alcohol dehydrogenase-like 4 isoform X2 [Glycine soja]